MKAYEIREKLNYKDVVSKKGKPYPNYPHIDDEMLTTPYIERFNELYGDLCLNGKIFRTMKQFGEIHGKLKRDSNINKAAKEMPIVEDATYDFEE